MTSRGSGPITGREGVNISEGLGASEEREHLPRPTGGSFEHDNLRRKAVKKSVMGAMGPARRRAVKAVRVLHEGSIMSRGGT